MPAVNCCIELCKPISMGINNQHNYADFVLFEFFVLYLREINNIIIETTCEVVSMAISYNKLWKMLIDKHMKKKDLQLAADVSASLITKMGRSEPVTTTVLMKICNALDCDIGDIMEIVPEEIDSK